MKLALPHLDREGLFAESAVAAHSLLKPWCSSTLIVDPTVITAGWVDVSVTLFRSRDGGFGHVITGTEVDDVMRIKEDLGP